MLVFSLSFELHRADLLRRPSSPGPVLELVKFEPADEQLQAALLATLAGLLPGFAERRIARVSGAVEEHDAKGFRRVATFTLAIPNLRPGKLQGVGGISNLKLRKA